jgi:hypothetical protein
MATEGVDRPRNSRSENLAEAVLFLAAVGDFISGGVLVVGKRWLTA